MARNEAQPLASNPRHYKYYELVMAGFVTVLLCSNMIGPGKTCIINLPLIGAVVFGAGNIFFPISYIFDDVLTEVYGYARARKVIWAGFGAMLFYVLMSQIVIRLPPDPKEDYNQVIQPAIETCFGAGPRIVTASLFAFWIGDFANSYVLAKMKLWTAGRFLWTRTIGSTIVGEFLDCVVFYPLAFAKIDTFLISLDIAPPQFLTGGWHAHTLFAVITFNWFFKVAIEVAFTPITYLVVGWLKRSENEDYYDRHTDFTPFSLKD